MQLTDVKCNECGGRKFVRTVFYYQWVGEAIDLDTGETSEDEMEREFMDIQSGWECATKNCTGYIEWDENQDDNGDDMLDDMFYEKKWGENR